MESKYAEGGTSKVEQQIECTTCPWNKNCIEPPTMTEDEVKAKMEEAGPKQGMDREEGEKSMMSGMLTAMFFGGKDTEAKVCPVFANALRKSPELSEKIKAIMNEG